MATSIAAFNELIGAFREQILDDWVEEQRRGKTLRNDLIPESQLRVQGGDFLDVLGEALDSGDLTSLSGAAWDRVRVFLKTASEKRVMAGYTPMEATAVLVSLKQPLCMRAHAEFEGDIETVDGAIWEVNLLLDKLAFFVMETFLNKKEEIIARQREEIAELSTPVVQIWEGVVILPLIGTLDSRRTQDMMERLLNTIVRFDARVAIIDITGVAAVDTLVAQHLLKTVAAARLMGAECMISGISPAIAQTIVQLGVSVGDVRTEYKLYDAFREALRMSGFSTPRKVEP